MVGWHHPADKTPVKDPRSSLSGRAHIVKQVLAFPLFDQKRKLSFVWKKRKKRERKKGRKGEKRNEKEMRFLFMPPAVCVLSLQSCQTLCYPVDCSPPGSSVHGILN